MRAVDGLLTGWHEPEATHLLMLEAIAGRPALERAYAEAHAGGYLWHEFGDSHLLLPEPVDDRRRASPPTLPEGRRAVLYALRRRGQATADDVARQLDMTVSGARQHLTALVDDGFAEATELPRPPGQRGRPQLAYMVTDRADALFPKAYGELTNELLGYVSEADSGLVDTLFARRRDERIRNATDRLAPQAHA